MTTTAEYITQQRREAKDLRKQVKLLREALTDAKAHLDYCGYGDAWEREIARAQKLEEKIDRALEHTK